MFFCLKYLSLIRCSVCGETLLREGTLNETRFLHKNLLKCTQFATAFLFIRQDFPLEYVYSKSFVTEMSLTHRSGSVSLMMVFILDDDISGTMHAVDLFASCNCIHFNWISLITFSNKTIQIQI